MSTLRITGTAHPAHGARLPGPQEGAEGEPRRRPNNVELGRWAVRRGVHGRKTHGNSCFNGMYAFFFLILLGFDWDFIGMS